MAAARAPTSGSAGTPATVPSTVWTIARPSSLSTSASSSTGIGAVEPGRSADPMRPRNCANGPNTSPA
jgi:hypothetical protein